MKFEIKDDERRTEIRYSLSGELPARLFIQGQRQALEYVLLDVSRKGIGLLVSPSPSSGSLLELVFDKEGLSITLCVRHMQPLLDETVVGLESTQRCGCELHEGQQGKIDLIEYFRLFSTVLIGE